MSLKAWEKTKTYLKEAGLSVLQQNVQHVFQRHALGDLVLAEGNEADVKRFQVILLKNESISQVRIQNIQTDLLLSFFFQISNTQRSGIFIRSLL